MLAHSRSNDLVHPVNHRQKMHDAVLDSHARKAGHIHDHDGVRLAEGLTNQCVNLLNALRVFVAFLKQSAQLFSGVVLHLCESQIRKRATTGVWSDGRSQVRGSLSIQDSLQSFARGSETQM